MRQVRVKSDATRGCFSEFLSNYTNPSNPAQKFVRNGNVYILTEEKAYTITGAEVK